MTWTVACAREYYIPDHCCKGLGSRKKEKEFRTEDGMHPRMVWEVFVTHWT